MQYEYIKNLLISKPEKWESIRANHFYLEWIEKEKWADENNENLNHILIQMNFLEQTIYCSYEEKELILTHEQNQELLRIVFSYYSQKLGVKKSVK